MATQFFSVETGEWAATRFFGGKGRGVCFDFGAREDRFDEVMRAANEGAAFVSSDGVEWSGEEFISEVCWSRVTHGEFSGSMEVGSGDIATFQGM